MFRIPTATDARSLIHFWQDYEDLERYADWTKIEPALSRTHPHLTRLWAEYKANKRLLDLALADLLATLEGTE